MKPRISMDEGGLPSVSERQEKLAGEHILQRIREHAERAREIVDLDIVIGADADQNILEAGH
jgi:hypothetical protein